MNRTAIIVSTTLALLAALPAAAQAKKKPVPRAVPAVAPLVLPPADSERQRRAWEQMQREFAFNPRAGLEV